MVSPIAGTLGIDDANGVAVLDLGSASLAALLASPAIAAADLSSAGLAAKIKRAVISGGAAGDLTVTGIAVTNVLIAVLYFPISAATVTSISDLTSEFTIATNKINNTAGTATTGGKLLVLYA